MSRNYRIWRTRSRTYVETLAGDLDVRLGDVKASHVRQVLEQLQETTQHLREIETTLGPARKLLDIKAEGASDVTDEADYVISIGRVEQGRLVNFNATSETMLLPGDVVEVKRKGRDPRDMESTASEAARDLDLDPTSILAEGIASPSR